MGHLFVVHGDLHRLDCDGWLLPTDAALRLEPWAEPAFEAIPRPDRLPAGWHETRRTLRVDRGDAPPVWLTDVGADRAMPMRWYLDGVRAFVDAASEDLAEPGGPGPWGREPPRDRPLLGLPLVATGEGGMGARPDAVLLELVPELMDLAGRGALDLALVTPDRLVYDAAQAARRRVGGLDELFGPAAAGPALRVVGDLAARVPGELGLFVGAGISMGAGLASWKDLIVRVTSRLDDGALADELRAVLDERRLDQLDVASLLATRLTGGDGALRAAVVEETQRARRHALGHGLLASLGCRRAVTTNYDQLYEAAVEGTGRPLAVLPYERPTADGMWLLKLHGDVERPDDVVLTRQDFLRYAADRNALTGVVHALLLTQHLLFVGYSLSDPNFHRIIDEVRQAAARAGPGHGESFGTVLVAEVPSPAIRELWGRDLDVVAPAEQPVSHGDDPTRRSAFRRHDLWLDALAMAASDPDAHLLSPRFVELLDPDQRRVAEALQPLADALGDPSLTGSAATRLRRLLADLGLP